MRTVLEGLRKFQETVQWQGTDFRTDLFKDEMLSADCLPTPPYLLAGLDTYLPTPEKFFPNRPGLLLFSNMTVCGSEKQGIIKKL
jgi:hypothetical protein